MNISVLEIGPGDSPAIEYPGSVLQQEGACYTAVEPRVKTVEILLRRHQEELERFTGDVVVGNSAELRFPDQSFSHVIMRSVFGEYTMPPAFTGSALHNTDYGIYEAFRVLEDDGELIVAEENTPYKSAGASRLASRAIYAGFEDITFFPCQELQNQDWREARTRFWDIVEQPDSKYGPAGLPLDSRLGYLMQARRPKIDTETFEVEISDKEAWRANMERGWNHPDNVPYSKTVELQKSVKKIVRDKDDAWSMFRQVSIVTTEGTIDMGTYLEELGSVDRGFLLAAN